jgi:hypothetical protein
MKKMEVPSGSVSGGREHASPGNLASAAGANSGTIDGVFPDKQIYTYINHEGTQANTVSKKMKITSTRRYSSILLPGRTEPISD